MARPRAFDEAAALDAATDRFWRNGYAAISMRDVGKAMGFAVSSLCNAFDDRHSPFMRCIDRYLDTACARTSGGSGRCTRRGWPSRPS
jgi:TetR/AcrR family transcriptional repressor of nem operon